MLAYLTAFQASLSASLSCPAAPAVTHSKLLLTLVLLPSVSLSPVADPAQSHPRAATVTWMRKRPAKELTDTVLVVPVVVARVVRYLAVRVAVRVVVVPAPAGKVDVVDVVEEAGRSPRVSVPVMDAPRRPRKSWMLRWRIILAAVVRIKRTMLLPRLKPPTGLPRVVLLKMTSIWVSSEEERVSG